MSGPARRTPGTGPGTPAPAAGPREDPTAGSASFGGVDLAADPVRTGIAVLREDHGTARVVVERAGAGATDEDILTVVAGCRRTGVDVPFGWPAPFARLLTAHAAGDLEPVADTGPDWRRELAQRTTDRAVRGWTGLTPLSVSTDRIAYPAFRWVNLAARLRGRGCPVPPDGSGAAVEVYPAAALRTWGLPFRGYKRDAARTARAALVDRLEALVPWLDWNGHRTACRDHDDVLDAVLSALVAREVHLGRTRRPAPDQVEAARAEGWIHVPTGPPSPPQLALR